MPIHRLPGVEVNQTVPEDWKPPQRFVDAMEAARHAVRIQRADYFCDQVSKHDGHRGFHPFQDPRRLSWGFTCDCEESIRVEMPISDIRGLDAQDMYVLYRRFHAIIEMDYEREQRRLARVRRASSRRARILLHRHLNRHQIRELKHNKEFTMVGKDGKTYVIEEKGCGNIKLIENGRQTKSFCVVFENHAPLPVHDLMLIQKFFLESDPQTIYETANISNIPQEPVATPRPPLDLTRSLADVLDGVRGQLREHWPEVLDELQLTQAS